MRQVRRHADDLLLSAAVIPHGACAGAALSIILHNRLIWASDSKSLPGLASMLLWASLGSIAIPLLVAAVARLGSSIRWRLSTRASMLLSPVGMLALPLSWAALTAAMIVGGMIEGFVGATELGYGQTAWARITGAVGGAVGALITCSLTIAFSNSWFWAFTVIFFTVLCLAGPMVVVHQKFGVGKISGLFGWLLCGITALGVAAISHWFLFKGGVEFTDADCTPDDFRVAFSLTGAHVLLAFAKGIFSDPIGWIFFAAAGSSVGGLLSLTPGRDPR